MAFLNFWGAFYKIKIRFFESAPQKFKKLCTVIDEFEFEKVTLLIMISLSFTTPLIYPIPTYDKKCVKKKERVRHLPGYCP